MNTVAGPIAYDQTAVLKAEGSAWGVEWSPAFLFPQLGETDKVRVQSTKAMRGEIYDRSGKGLAINEDRDEVGIVPGKLTDSSVAKAGELLKIKPEDIQAKLQAAWVKPELFVPLTVVSKGDPRLEALLAIPGVGTRTKKVRAYPLGEAAAHLTGYVGRINGEELERLKSKGYQPDDWIGKTGLELSLEARLRGQDGGRVYITGADGKEKATLAQREAVDGEAVKLTIDAAYQESLYRQLSKDAAAGVELHPLTGDILALVSTPSYDPNVWVSGVSNDQWKQWNENPDKPLLNRFARAYSPGSAFKPIMAAVALQVKTLDPEAVRTITGKEWRKDASWGNYYVSRVSQAAEAVDLSKALLYSDNIYFAQVALELGKDRFVQSVTPFGFGEKLDLPLAIDSSSLAVAGIKSDIQLADSGYGQGEVLMTPLHVAAAYTVFTNGGSMLKPVLERKGGPVGGEIWKSGLISPEISRLMTSKLTAVIDDSAGTGHAAQIPGLRLAGKTGTAELKQKKGEAGQENGWFVAYDTDNPRLIVALMVEQVEQRGGSHYLASKIKAIFQGLAG
ncbi:penicillin-binding transpeptidase domain-containing protein [Paenibacillus filicis]|uniref:Penicillin-binding transpeptidase domain-containing protein n=1 Tax=Paenibacillus gyeongsangnamensis TaxID=3388067 RepID=A0ABT4QI75_9BACL|nr:penicillin-binding transpeptidase domain-containing protein [Paenibacillus filicis]MCZ8516545.1 penicillin-binding transpeptidase domain-containing protein [Paenibacillus filicis]